MDHINILKQRELKEISMLKAKLEKYNLSGNTRELLKKEKKHSSETPFGKSSMNNSAQSH
jgi:hypothetical protein